MVKNSKKLKQSKFENEDVTQIRNLIIIFIIVVLISVGLYFLTDNMIKRESNSNNTTQEVEIDNDIATIGTMFNRIEEEYYVLIYSSEENSSDLDSVLTKYRSSDNYLKTYYIDLDKKVNNSALGDKLVKEPKNSKEVKVTGATLYKIKNGSVIKCYSGVEEITNVLS